MVYDYSPATARRVLSTNCSGNQGNSSESHQQICLKTAQEAFTTFKPSANLQRKNSSASTKSNSSIKSNGSGKNSNSLNRNSGSIERNSLNRKSNRSGSGSSSGSSGGANVSNVINTSVINTSVINTSPSKPAVIAQLPPSPNKRASSFFTAPQLSPIKPPQLSPIKPPQLSPIKRAPSFFGANKFSPSKSNNKRGRFNFNKLLSITNPAFENSQDSSDGANDFVYTSYRDANNNAVVTTTVATIATGSRFTTPNSPADGETDAGEGKQCALCLKYFKTATHEPCPADPGRVQVFVRIRPTNEDETKYSNGCTIADDENTQIRVTDGKTDRLYQFDGILNDEATNKQVFSTVGEPLVYSALSGFNGILMCYGQTGSGKTYTLMSNDGMSVRVVYKCFRIINADRRHKYTVTCSYLQIYQEKIYDLLNATHNHDLALREHPKTGVYIENLTDYVVHSPREVLNLIKIGRSRLVFAETQMNRASSRSHAICQLKFFKERAGIDDPGLGMRPSSAHSGFKTPDFDLSEEDDALHQELLEEGVQDSEIMSNLTDLEDGVTSVRGKIYICDLAGSERIKKTKASGERLQEAQHINSSLLELGNVIQALAEGSHRSHVPFRNSTLTRLLQEGLSGNCKTRLVVCVAPTIRDTHESKCSLNFGSRAMKVQVMAHVNYEVDYKKLAEALAAKLEALEQESQMQRSEHEKLIATLKNELNLRKGRTSSQTVGGFDDSKQGKSQIQSLLILELMTLQLFFSLRGRGHVIDNAQHAQISFQTGGNQDTILRSMEGLLELLDDYLRGRGRARHNSNNSSTNSSCITSPDLSLLQEPNNTPYHQYPATLEPVAQFLEHASLNRKSSHSGTGSSQMSEMQEHNTGDRMKRVMDMLVKLKESVSAKAMKSLHDTIQAVNMESDGNKLDVGAFHTLEDVAKLVAEQQDLHENLALVTDTGLLESSLHYVLMDKALLSCLFMLQTQAGTGFNNNNNNAAYAFSGEVDQNNNELKRILEDLTSERSEKQKLSEQLYSVSQEKERSDERLMDVELELKAVRELKSTLEEKLCTAENDNDKLETQIEETKVKVGELEKKIAELERKKASVELNLKNSDNNNARKERIIVDLKNEKVALDSLVATLKEELALLEKEKVRETEDRRHLEEELEDVRDRNIILETEWSCCREENGLLETELTALEEDKVLLEDELVKYRDDVKMLEEALSVLEAQASDYKQEILTLKHKEDRLVDGVRVEKEKFTKEINSLRQEISGLRVERREFQRDISVSRADKSNTERAYTALKTQRDSLQTDLSTFRQEEKKLQRELALLKSDKTKLEREVQAMRTENGKLKQELQQADKLRTDIKMLQKNEEKIVSMFGVEKDKIIEQLSAFKEKFSKMETDFTKVVKEKENLAKQLKRYSNVVENARSDSSASARGKTPSHTPKSTPTPDKAAKRKSTASMINENRHSVINENRQSIINEQQGAVQRRSIHEGHVTEVEGKILDLQRRLAFFMAEKEDIQKELMASRERNEKLTSELRTLENDTSKIQLLLATLNKDKHTLQTRLEGSEEANATLGAERDQLKEAVTCAKDITVKLQSQLDEVTDHNRVLEVDQQTLQASVKQLQAEATTLEAVNKHVRSEFDLVEKELEIARGSVQELNKSLKEMQTKVSHTQESECALKEKVEELETRNVSLSDQLSACKQDEEELVEQLKSLTNRFQCLEGTLEKVLVERTASIEESTRSQELMKQVQSLKEQNCQLETTTEDLKIQLETLVLDAETLKEEREEVEKQLGRSCDKNKGELVTSVKHLNQQVSSIKREKAQLESNFAALEKQMDDLKGQNKQLAQAKEKSSLSPKERKVFQQQVDELQSQVGNLVRDKKQLEAELDFMKQQNGELRTEIAIILEENDKMEHELTELEEDFEKQEVQLDSATEETKNLLRQLCSAESKNLQLSTIAHDFENYQSELKKLGEEKCDAQSEKNTIHDRLIMAELEISRLKSELKAVEYQRQLLLDDLDAADKERSVLKGELQNLARAISPLKREVNAAILKNDDHVLTVKCDLTYSKLASDKESLEKHTSEQPKALPSAEPVNELSIQDEINLVQAEMEGYARERQEIDEEQSSLQQRLSCLKRDREDMRSKLHDLIQDIDERNRMKHEEPMTEIEDSMKLISFLIAQRDNLDQEKVLVETNLMDANDKKKKLNIKVGTACEQLKNSQEDMLLASIGHMKLNERVRKIDRCMSEIKYSDSEEIYGLTRLQEEVKKLKVDIRNFETSQDSLLCEVRTLNEQLDIAENNLVNVTHFRNVIENNIREYKHRNSTLESHLRSIYSDLVQMEAHECEEKPSVDVPVKSTKILLETLDLQKHLDFLEKDLKKTENKHVDLVQDTIDLTDRCSQLEEEKHMHDINQEQTQESIASQLKLISQLQKDKESLMYDKSRLSTKLSLYRDDKNRLLDDFQRLNKSLTAYARYNSELEQKLQSFQSEMDELEMQAKYVSTENQMKIVKALTSSGSNGHSSNLLCPRCTEKMRKRFEGVTAKGTLQRGDQLLDCVNDNLSLETAILTFMNQKGHLEQQLMNIDQDRRQLEDMLTNLGCADSNHSTLRYNADGSQTQIDEEFIKRLWSSGQLSSRSKSMTSHSGDSFLDDDDDSGTNPSSSRSHTALGIYKSSNPTSRTSSLACSPPTSPPTTRAATTSPLASRRQPAPTLSPQMGRRRRKLSNDEAYESQELSKESGGESGGNNLLESLNEEASGCREAATTSNSTCSSKDSTNNQNQKDELAGKSSHHGMSGFLKKFRSSKRGSASKRSSSKPGVDRALSPQSVSSRTSSDTDSHAHDAHAHDSHTQQGAL